MSRPAGRWIGRVGRVEKSTMTTAYAYDYIRPRPAPSTSQDVQCHRCVRSSVCHSELFRSCWHSHRRGQPTRNHLSSSREKFALGRPCPADPARGAAVIASPPFARAARKAAPWARPPVTAQYPPSVLDVASPLAPVDRLMLAKLEAKALLPAVAGDKRALLRR